MHLFLDVILGFVFTLYCICESVVKTFIPLSYRAKDVSGEIVLITGAGSGLGRSMAIKFAKLGCKLVLWDINKKGNDETEKMIKNNGGVAFAYVCDLRNREDIYKTAERTKNEVGTVTMLINNAGVVTGKKLLKCPDDKIQMTFDVNVLAHYWTVKCFLPGMLDVGKGHIVTIASCAGLGTISRLTDYCGSKFAAVGFNEALHVELMAGGHADKIHTTCVCPFYINTGMFAGVESGVVPILDYESASQTVVENVLAEQRMVLIPRLVLALDLFSKTVLPWKAHCYIRSVLGNLNHSMNTFKGRENQHQT